MTAVQAFQLTIGLAEDWLRDLRRFHQAVTDAALGRRPLAEEWRSLILGPADGAALTRASADLGKAVDAVQRSIDGVRLALAEARLSDAIISIKQWDIHFERMIASIVGDGPRESKVLPPAYVTLKPGTEAVNKALDMRFETIGTITTARKNFGALLESSLNPWR